MVRAIYQRGLHPNHRETGEHALLRAFPQPLFHSGEVVLGHRSAEHRFGKFQLFAVAGLKFDPHVAELTMAA